MDSRARMRVEIHEAHCQVRARGGSREIFVPSQDERSPQVGAFLYCMNPWTSEGQRFRPACTRNGHDTVKGPWEIISRNARERVCTVCRREGEAETSDDILGNCPRNASAANKLSHHVPGSTDDRGAGVCSKRRRGIGQSANKIGTLTTSGIWVSVSHETTLQRKLLQFSRRFPLLEPIYHSKAVTMRCKDQQC